MALALELTKPGVQKHPYNSEGPFEERDGGWSLQRIDLDTEAWVSDMAAGPFEEHAQDATVLSSLESLIRRRYDLRARLLQVSSC
jgi:hypothetical protein